MVAKEGKQIVVMDSVKREDPALTQKIETLVKVLGTMVMKPQYESDPNVIGSKVFSGMLQVPIVSEEDRKIIEVKLLELVNQL